MTWIVRLLVSVAGLYALVVLGVWLGQGQLVYGPDPTRVDPRALQLEGVAERTVVASDGVRIVSWYGKAQPGQPTLLYFHGNGGNLARRTDRIRMLMGRGLGIYMMSYRGYSGSQGSPSEAANIADARNAYADLAALGVDPRNIVLYGESMGTGVATPLAVDTPVAGLILDAPFTSVVDVGAARYPWLPVRWLLSHRYETIRVIGKVRVPLLVVHGEADGVVPVEMGRMVFAAAVAAEPKRLLTIPGGRHSNHYPLGSFEAIVAFAQGLAQPVTEKKPLINATPRAPETTDRLR